MKAVLTMDHQGIPDGQEILKSTEGVWEKGCPVGGTEQGILGSCSAGLEQRLCKERVRQSWGRCQGRTGISGYNADRRVQTCQWRQWAGRGGCEHRDALDKREIGKPHGQVSETEMLSSFQARNVRMAHQRSCCKWLGWRGGRDITETGLSCGMQEAGES